MKNKHQALLILNGVAIFLVGLAAGFPLAFIETGTELWGVTLPIIGHWDIPGNYARWKMAHLEGVLNGVLCIALAGVATKLPLGARASAFIFWGAVVTAWCNIAASVLGALFNARGLDWGQGLVNDINYNVFIVGIVLIPLVLIVLAHSAWKLLQQAESE